MFFLAIILFTFIMFVLLVFASFKLRNCEVSYYVINYTYIKNNKIHFVSDLRFCKAHYCYEIRDILDSDKWELTINDFAPIKWKNLYFTDKETLKQFKKYRKQFKANYNEIKYMQYS